MAGFRSDDTEGMRKMARLMGPGMVDQQIRQAIQFCWMAMPPERQTVANVTAEVRRIVDRALQDFAADAQAFCDEPAADQEEGDGDSVDPPNPPTAAVGLGEPAVPPVSPERGGRPAAKQSEFALAFGGRRTKTMHQTSGNRRRFSRRSARRTHAADSDDDHPGSQNDDALKSALPAA
jgi:hypothetical protein